MRSTTNLLSTIVARTVMGTRKYEPHNPYVAKHRKDLNIIKRILEVDPTPQIYIGKNWVRINNQTFNGISIDELEEIKKEISCNVAINNV